MVVYGRLIKIGTLVLMKPTSSIVYTVIIPPGQFFLHSLRYISNNVEKNNNITSFFQNNTPTLICFSCFNSDSTDHSYDLAAYIILYCYFGLFSILIVPRIASCVRASPWSTYWQYSTCPDRDHIRDFKNTSPFPVSSSAYVSSFYMLRSRRSSLSAASLSLSSSLRSWMAYTRLLDVMTHARGVTNGTLEITLVNWHSNWITSLIHS